MSGGGTPPRSPPPWEDGEGPLPQDGAQLRAAAEGGDPEAQTAVGLELVGGEEEGWGEGATWLQRAAEQGHAGAQCELGSCYQGGWGVEASAERAVEHWRSAAEQGHGEAQFHLATSHMRGEGVGESREEAFRWFLRAATGGFTAAMTEVANCYHEAHGVERCYEEAARWFRKAAEEGDDDDGGEAACGLGACYQHGHGVPADADEAARWYRQAARQGSAEATSHLQKLRGRDPEDEDGGRRTRRRM